jgi:hypothetical protein
MIRLEYDDLKRLMLPARLPDDIDAATPNNPARSDPELQNSTDVL